VIELLTLAIRRNQHRKHTKGVLQFPFRSVNDDSIQDNFLIHQRVAHPVSSGNPGTIRAVNEFGVPTPPHKGESTMSARLADTLEVQCVNY
jgi:hypothetical protein